MRIIKRYGEDSQGAITMFKAGIDLFFDNKDFVKMADYQRRLKAKFGIDYEPYESLGKIVPSLDTIHSVQDFRNLNEFRAYCSEMYSMRWTLFGSQYADMPEGKKVSFESMQSVLTAKGYTLESYYDKKDSAVAQVRSKTVLVNLGHEDMNKDGNIYLGIFIHELGHVFEYEKRLVQTDLLSRTLLWLPPATI